MPGAAGKAREAADQAPELPEGGRTAEGHFLRTGVLEGGVDHQARHPEATVSVPASSALEVLELEDITERIQSGRPSNHTSARGGAAG